MIVTEYDLPRKEALPHDVIVDADGHAWYSDFGNQFVGELDPKTGKVQDYALETLRQDQPKGPLGLEFDPEGNIWVGMSYQAGASKIDRKTKQVTTYPLPKEWQGITSQTNMVTPTHMNVDGKVWMEDTENGRVFRLDLTSGKWEDRGVATTAKGETIRGYGVPADKDNNLYLMSFGDTRIGKLDAKTNVAQIWSTAFARSRPRRGRFDDQNRLWFAEYAANRIAMFDPTTEQIKEWKLPTAWSAALRRGAEQGRRGSVDRLDADRPGRAAQPEDRRDRRIPAAAHHQHPPRLRPGERTAPGAVGRQQSRQRHRQGRAARLSCSAHLKHELEFAHFKSSFRVRANARPRSDCAWCLGEGQANATKKRGAAIKQNALRSARKSNALRLLRPLHQLASNEKGPGRPIAIRCRGKRHHSAPPRAGFPPGAGLDNGGAVDLSPHPRRRMHRC